MPELSSCGRRSDVVYLATEEDLHIRDNGKAYTGIHTTPHPRFTRLSPHQS